MRERSVTRKSAGLPQAVKVGGASREVSAAICHDDGRVLLVHLSRQRPMVRLARCPKATAGDQFGAEVLER